MEFIWWATITVLLLGLGGMLVVFLKRIRRNQERAETIIRNSNEIDSLKLGDLK